jgi:hypothetical protein
VAAVCSHAGYNDTNPHNKARNPRNSVQNIANTFENMITKTTKKAKAVKTNQA